MTSINSIQQSDSSHRWYRQATEQVVALREAIQVGAPLSLRPIEESACALAASVVHDDDLVRQALGAPEGNALVANMVRVGVFATKVGVGLNFNGEELTRLSLAALLHDIGMFTVPTSLLAKSGPLSRTDRSVLERHPIEGQRLISALGSQYDWLAGVVRQAHERWGGQGYPDRLHGTAICEAAHIIGMCDLFEALISPRPYRRRLLPHEAMHEIFLKERVAFPREILKALVEQFGVYPLGTEVRVNSGDAAIVMRTNPQFPLRPLVRVVDSHGVAHAHEAGSLDYDLSKTPHLYVTAVLHAPGEGVGIDKSEATQLVAAPSAVEPERQVYADDVAALFESLDDFAIAISDVMGSHQHELDQPSRRNPA
ncbi:MAG: HD domain-containing protein [Nitrospiraceae bacterium]